MHIILRISRNCSKNVVLWLPFWQGWYIVLKSLHNVIYVKVHIYSEFYKDIFHQYWAMSFIVKTHTDKLSLNKGKLQKSYCKTFFTWNCMYNPKMSSQLHFLCQHEFWASYYFLYLRHKIFENIVCKQIH